ncbi:hypothetical protein WN944_006579 [Citrus x changshan-huyou]|uniref:Uncharacterized protein n=1 Tax=Citrus x changshan-huyou TaxID=2935761 RepID=A0AAP0MJE0_9ROSI
MGQERPSLIDGFGATQRQDDNSTWPIKISHVEGLAEGSLMKQGMADKQQTIGCSNVAEIADGELMFRDMSILAGNNEKKERENAMEIEKKNTDLMGLNTQGDDLGLTQKFSEDEAAGACTNVKDKKKKWKSQARERVIKGNGNGGPTSLKRPREGQLRVSPECKKMKKRRSGVSQAKLNQLSLSPAKLDYLRVEGEGSFELRQGNVTENATMDAENQPRRQP